MKLKVNRKLNGGKYFVDFTATDFSPDEISKMESFGVPSVRVHFTPSSGGRAVSMVGITQLGPHYKASFDTEEEAKRYQETIVTQIREAMKRLREQKDDFSSDEEVNV